jgi:hypothetical protein
LALLVPPPLVDLGSSGALEVSVPGVSLTSKGAGMPVSLERLARNQVLFREVNERVSELAEAGRIDPIAFLCECSRMDCDEMIELDRAEYEGIRSSSNLFVIALGHETPEVERIVEGNHRFALVEKTNGAQLAVDTDPRTRGP